MSISANNNNRQGQRSGWKRGEFRLRGLTVATCIVFCLVLPELVVADTTIPDSYRSQWHYQNCVETVKMLDGQVGNVDKSGNCLLWMDGFRLGIGIGVLYTSRVLGHFDELKDTAGYHYLFSCAPNLNNESFIRVFVQGMKSKPELFSVDIIDAVKAIFAIRFPCAAR